VRRGATGRSLPHAAPVRDVAPLAIILRAAGQRTADGRPAGDMLAEAHWRAWHEACAEVLRMLKDGERRRATPRAEEPVYTGRVYKPKPSRPEKST